MSSISFLDILTPTSTVLKPWQAYDDRAYGGKSSCTVDIMKEELNNGQVAVDHGPFKLAQTSSFVNFVGELIYDDEVATNTKAKSSFCGCKANAYKVIDLRDYQGLQLTVTSMTDIKFTLNLGCENELGLPDMVSI